MELVLPSGIRLTAPDEMALTREFARHAAASMTEGLCPRHGTQLMPVKAALPQIGGHCGTCGQYWRYAPDLDEVGAWVDIDPRTGWPAEPDWVQP